MTSRKVYGNVKEQRGYITKFVDFFYRKNLENSRISFKFVFGSLVTVFTHVKIFFLRENLYTNSIFFR